MAIPKEEFFADHQYLRPSLRAEIRNRPFQRACFSRGILENVQSTGQYVKAESKSFYVRSTIIALFGLSFYLTRDRAAKSFVRGSAPDGQQSITYFSLRQGMKLVGKAKEEPSDQ